ncbi:MAG: glycosyltransferase family 2 protein, partial [Candidatus Faecousia sp.]|nr:glycosyltransferase family 2 protein [Candidatus Faecousia sp.]
MHIPKVSVVIPVYKVEPYLRRCVDSVLAQTLSDLEIILVDDGSPDHCPEICDEYALTHQNIQVIHKTNGGLASARNAGMRIAQGEYILFVDSDDWIDPEMAEELVA